MAHNSSVVASRRLQLSYSSSMALDIDMVPKGVISCLMRLIRKLK